MRKIYLFSFVGFWAVVLAVAMVELPPLWQRGFSSSQSAAQETGAMLQSEDRININTAVAAELVCLEGIGEAKAQAIITYREANGPFKSIEALTEVHGISEKTLANICGNICVS